MKQVGILIAMVLAGGCLSRCPPEEPEWVAAVQYEFASTGRITVEADGSDRYWVSGQSIPLRDMCDLQEQARIPSEARVIIAPGPDATPADLRRARLVLRWQFPNLAVQGAP